MIPRAARAARRLAKSSLARASGIYVLASATSALISFLVVPVLTRLLGPEDYGVVASFAALVSVASVIVGLSAHGILSVRFFSPTRHPFASYVGTCLAVMLSSTLAVGLVLLVFAPVVADLTGVPAEWQWSVLAAATGQFAATVALTVLQVHRRARAYAVVQVASAALAALASVALIAGTDMGWKGRALALASSNIITGIAAVAFLRSTGNLSVRIRREQVAEILRFGLPLMPHALAAVVMATVDRLTITAKVGLADAGVYFAAVQICSIISLVSLAVNQAWVPWLYERISVGRADAKLAVVRATYLVFSVLGLAALLLAFAAPWFVRWFAGETFSEAADHMRFLAPAAALSGMYYFVANYIFYSGRTELMSLITVSSSLVQVALTVGLVAAYGAGGAAAAALLSALVYFAATWYVAQRCVPMPWFNRAT